VTTNATLAVTAYGDPFTFATTYGFDTPERLAVVDAYQSTQRLLCITGICLSLPLIFFGLCTRNPKLGKEQSLPDAEKFGSESGSEYNAAVEREAVPKKAWYKSIF